MSIRFFNRVTRIIKFSKSSKKVPTISSAVLHYTVSITDCQVKSFLFFSSRCLFLSVSSSVFCLSVNRHGTIILDPPFVKRFIGALLKIITGPKKPPRLQRMSISHKRLRRLEQTQNGAPSTFQRINFPPIRTARTPPGAIPLLSHPRPIGIDRHSARSIENDLEIYVHIIYPTVPSPIKKAAPNGTALLLCIA